MFNKKKSLAFLVVVVFVLSLFLIQTAQAGDVFIFNKNLQIGSVNTDVKELQKFLNSNGFSLNKSGAGSLGKETIFFGPATRNALIKFQKANKINPAAGYFGLITRAVVNKKPGLLPVSSVLPINQVKEKSASNQTNNQTSQDIKTNYYSISGSITGITGAVVLQNNGKDDLVIEPGQNSNFNFSTSLADGANYNVTVKSKSLGQTCYVSNNTGSVSGADVKNVKVACGANLSYNPFTYIPSGGSAPRVNTYAITFDANGSTGGTKPANQTKTQDATLVLAANSGSLIKTSHTFSGWNTSADGSGTDYAVGANYTANTALTLYAKWVITAPSALSYNSNNLFLVGQAIETLSPTVTGVVDSYSISPNLPAGLSLNTSSGQITGTPTVSTDSITYTVTATNTGGSTTFNTLVIMVVGTVTGADGRVWLDRNLGAARVATSFDDYQSYGSLFQWGRSADGHQLINHTAATAATAVNGSTSTLATSDTPGNNLFIMSPSFPYEWRSSQNDNLWQGVNGTNNVCPAGFRLPTQPEWSTLVSSEGITNYTTAYSSSLKLTAAGHRYLIDASLKYLGVAGYYWSSSVNGSLAYYLNLGSSIAGPAYSDYRATGFSVRCIQEIATAPSSITLALGSSAPVGGVVNVAIPAADATDTTGAVTGWVATSADKIKFTVVNGGSATSSITIGGAEYTSGADYTIPSTSTLAIIVTTTETNRATVTRTFTISVAAYVTPTVGMSYQGGKVAYILQSGDTGYVAGQTHGIIAATADQGTNILWAKPANISISVGDTLVTIGSGSANTDKIIAQNSLDSTYAAGLARSYSGGGYTDWYLPSKDELNKLYLQKTAIGSFVDSWYFSSSEFSPSNAWLQNLGTGNQVNAFKSLPNIYVRAVRSF